MKHYEIVVIGSGPGGYVAAIRCAQLGKKVAIIERYATLGGTCLNVGCIPSKALLDSSHHYDHLKNHSQQHGINVDKAFIKFDLNQMMNRKNDVVDKTIGGINYLMKKNKIDVYYGHGSFNDSNLIEIKSLEKEDKISFNKAIIATGSKPNTLPFIKVDKERIITSTEALALKEIPKHLMIIGGGVIGLELGQVYHRLGSQVSIIEYEDRIISSMDSDMSKELTRVFKKSGINFYVSHQVTSVNRHQEIVTVQAKNNQGESESFEGDYCLVSVGRKPYTENLGLEKVGVEVNDFGQIRVDSHLQTSVSNIYAIGDVIQGAMLAHKAEEEGILVAEYLSGQKPHIDYNLIPNVIYSWPEVASVGKTEDQIKQIGQDYKVGKFPMRALGRARASGDIDGLVKIIADKQTDQVLGVHIIGARASDIIAEAVVAMEFQASAEDIARISHAHPTFTEAVKEAALSASENRPIHL
ncbi:MAG: dihydrolipoyl dehydrogenase [Flavobacteriaceae bacterium]|nr:dihydrolipoyl dehydrogenase [Flavobacteriaceae bacterium]MCY4266303.1 dihydrolipoyl dehydrogenase [Flavobacteriaceae bacterium]MCY4299224.1 dihydrolipoyl dehydrogenase [Flavobacteriaceae bacterium]